LDVQAQQMADAVNGALGIAGSTTAINITEQSFEIASTIRNNTAQIVSSAATAANILNIQGNKCVNGTYSYIDQDAYATSMITATQDNTAVNSAVTKLKATIDQTATAASSSAIAGIILIGVVVLIWLIVGLKKSLFGHWQFWMFVVGAIALVYAIAVLYFAGEQGGLGEVWWAWVALFAGLVLMVWPLATALGHRKKAGTPAPAPPAAAAAV